MTYFQKLTGYLNITLTHKRAVFKACKKAGQPWRGFWHDTSKLLPAEFFQSVKYYEVGKSPHVVAINQGHEFPAWQHHVGHNPHHWEYWVDRRGLDGDVPLKMPYSYFVEMVCDWIGASKTYSTFHGKEWSMDELHSWYERTKQYQIFHPYTKAMVVVIMNLKTEEEIYEFLRFLKG